ncbi:hypothetical protein AMECASPLE_022349 [Ameca splendens]|uniref:Uncharacterized protein n=1 Tax=Ameca splendens TaxID=208324 RepID=A0ABV0YFC6_9TELE
MNINPHVNPSIFYISFFRTESRGSWCLSPGVEGQEAGYTLDRSPVHRRATQRHTGQTTMHTHTLSPRGNFRESNIFGLWEEGCIPGENPCVHGENMQTACRKIPEPSATSATNCSPVQPHINPHRYFRTIFYTNIPQC